jgi:hypothetical protein
MNDDARNHEREELYMFSDRFSVHHQQSSTVYTALGICHTGYADCRQHNLYGIYLLLCVQ